VSLWGLVRPAAATTTATIEIRGKTGPWHALKTVRTDARGYFVASGALVADRQWRLTWRSPDGVIYRGTPTRAYAG
jgi:hypothetical protein